MKMVFLPAALLFCLPRAYGNDNRRVIRGGGWDTEPYAARTYDRDAKKASTGDDEVGFRLVR